MQGPTDFAIENYGTWQISFMPPTNITGTVEKKVGLSSAERFALVAQYVLCNDNDDDDDGDNDDILFYKEKEINKKIRNFLKQ